MDTRHKEVKDNGTEEETKKEEDDNGTEAETNGRRRIKIDERR